MFASLTRAVLLLAVVVVVASAAGAQRCRDRSVGAHLHAVMSYNATGHWLAVVRLERETTLPGRPSELVLDVRPSATQCGSARTDALVVSLEGPPPPAGPGFEEVPGVGFYKVHPEAVSWEQAKTACETENAHLLILNSEAEAAGVQQLLKRHPKINAWVHVGFHDKQQEGNYVTIFGQPLSATGFSRWNPGQPDNAGNNENCGSIHVAEMGLNDLPCTTYKAPFVCEQSVGYS